MNIEPDDPAAIAEQPMFGAICVDFDGHERRNRPDVEEVGGGGASGCKTSLEYFRIHSGAPDRPRLGGSESWINPAKEPHVFRRSDGQGFTRGPEGAIDLISTEPFPGESAAITAQQRVISIGRTPIGGRRVARGQKCALGQVDI